MSESRFRNLSLDEWLVSLRDPDHLSVTWSFPSDSVRDEYLATIGERSDEDVRNLLRRFLLSSCELGGDRLQRDYLAHLREHDPESFEKAKRRDFVRRLLDVGAKREPTWQGITWTLDLLPHWPMTAIEALDAYLLAHVQQLPDGRIDGLQDAQAIIRAMYIGNPVSAAEKLELVYQLGDRRFEHLVESLYDAMGYETALTSAKMDGGRDVIAVRKTPGEKQRVLVECKLRQRPIGVEFARALLGVVSNERSSKGVIVTASRFTRGARELADENSRLELIGWNELLPLLDGYLGSSWGRLIDRLLATSVARSGE
jgi:restriction system protein